MARWGRLRHILFRGFPGCVSIVACRAPFPPPAHRTGRADFPHPALRRASQSSPQLRPRRNLRLTVESLPGRSGSFVLLGRSQSQSLCPFHHCARSEAPLLHRHYPVSTLLRASPPPTRPGLALAGCPLWFATAVSVGFPCFMCIPSMHAIVSTPADLQSASVADFLCNAGLPRMSGGSASASIVSRPHRAFTCVTACIFAGSPSDPFHRRLRRIRCLLRRFDCYWASDPSQAGLPPAETHTHSRRTVRTIFCKLSDHESFYRLSGT